LGPAETGYSNKRWELLSKDVAMLLDNGLPHTATHTVESLYQLKMEVLEHAPFNPGLSFSDNCLVHPETLCETAISPVTKNWKNVCTHGLSLNQKHIFLRVYRRFWATGLSVMNRTGTV
jgi:hypothetical protein